MNMPFSRPRLHALYRRHTAKWKNLRKLRRWERDGRSIPPPHVVKQMVVREYANRFLLRSFCETGTYEGEMVEAVKEIFDVVVSIELDPRLYEEACRRFRDDSHVVLIQGDSGKVLPEALSRLNEPTLFWLDGHYSGGKTARGERDTPIMKELECICSHGAAKDHVILIDDARCFTDEGDYPGIPALEQYARAAQYDCFEIRDDIVRIFRSRPAPHPGAR